MWIKLYSKVMKMNESRTGAPVFVRIEDYKEVLEVLDMIKGKVREIKQTLGSLTSLRNEEDSELVMWNKAISDIENKIEGIDKSLFEPENM